MSVSEYMINTTKLNLKYRKFIKYLLSTLVWFFQSIMLNIILSKYFMILFLNVFWNAFFIEKNILCLSYLLRFREYKIKKQKMLTNSTLVVRITWPPISYR
jgi:hypothetical protein